jgi:hypothetical protein
MVGNGVSWSVWSDKGDAGDTGDAGSELFQAQTFLVVLMPWGVPQLGLARRWRNWGRPRGCRGIDTRAQGLFECFP